MVKVVLLLSSTAIILGGLRATAAAQSSRTTVLSHIFGSEATVCVVVLGDGIAGNCKVPICTLQVGKVQVGGRVATQCSLSPNGGSRLD